MSKAVFCMCAFLAAVLLVSIVIAEGNQSNISDEVALAIESEAIDNVTAHETELMQSSHFGAQVRILELKKAAIKSYISANVVVSYLSAKGRNISELTAILAEMSALKTEIGALKYNVSDAVHKFVNAKHDLKELNRDFRKAAITLLNGSDRKVLQENIRNELNKSTELAAIHEELKAALRNLNAERVEKMLSKMGKLKRELIDRIRSGNFTKNNTVKEIIDDYKNLSTEIREEFRQKIKDAIDEKQAARINLVEKIKENHVQAYILRLRARMSKLPAAARISAQNRIENRIEFLNKIEDWAVRRRTALEGIQARLQNRTENWTQRRTGDNRMARNASNTTGGE